MGIHFNNAALKDATLDVEKPEVLVYEKRPDGTFQLNGVEYLVPFTAWTKTEPPTIMGQSLKRADVARLLVPARVEREGEPVRPVRRLESDREVLKGRPVQ